MRINYFILAAVALATQAAVAQTVSSTNMLVSPGGMATTNSVAATNAPAEAASALRIDTRTDSERIEFLMRVAQVYIEEKEFAAAVSAYERVLEIDPKHQQARYVLGHVYINAKQYEQAEEQLLALVADYPEDFTLLNNLAWLYATAEDPKVRDGEKAIDLAQEAMVMSPYSHHVWSTLSEAYYVTGRYDEALRAIEHMARVASRYGKGITKDAVDEYNAQIRKCQRAMEAQKVIEGDAAEE